MCLSLTAPCSESQSWFVLLVSSECMGRILTRKAGEKLENRGKVV